MNSDLDALDIATLASELAADKKSTDIVVLDLRELSSVTDYFVICSGRSDIQVKAISNNVLDGFKARGIPCLSTEGIEQGHWALLDFGEAVVHVFQQQTRELFDLERLWREAPRWTYEPGSAIQGAPA